MGTGKPLVIDGHQHFWDPADGSCGWMTEDYAAIRRVFTPEDLRPALAAAGVDRTILVQTWHSLGETRGFLVTASRTDFVAGVVGWVDLTEPEVAATVSELKARPDGHYLVGIRHLVHNETDPNWLLRAEVQRGLAAVAEAGLVYDLLLKEPQIPAALETVERHPNLRFVVDHIAKPRIAQRAMEPWAGLMQGFAAHRDHVWCKLSGMVTEADWRRWNSQDLQPYVDAVLSIFGPSRCLFGSDWPVCLVAANYRSVKRALDDCLSGLTEQERSQIFGASALEAYRLSL
ncbi:amidohydrolase family protein [Mesorhizobium sp. WSM3862]|uniref:amidohydrolase family protein n=1 Tax=Mesorhizobium sp. WSM3862 TaxID=632858 RepID=UPI000BB06AEF|nr:amidohydrolase family protein [Mesorhizobium sp. WSM3862]PBB99497.1 amidohydrolase [Mesorhizobium sp. WSM3862]